jgi:hypothetical protein
MYAVTVTFNEQYFQKLLFDFSLISVFHFYHLDLNTLTECHQKGNLLDFSSKVHLKVETRGGLEV